MAKRQPVGMQAKPLKFPAAAPNVANDRVPHYRAVNAKLIRPSRHWFEFEQRAIRVSLFHPISGLGVLAVRFDIPEFSFRETPDRHHYRSFVVRQNPFD